MANLVFSVKTVKYGTPTGTNTMPASGSMTALPDTVKGSITIEETEGANAEFYVDQKAEPIKVINTDMPKLGGTMQFYDLTFATMAVLKGGTGNVSGYTPPIGFTLIEKAIEIETDSGHTFQLFNAAVNSRIVNGGGRDKLFALETNINPQLTADLAGSWKIIPTA